MADRSITVNVKAVVSDFEAGMSRAEQKTKQFDKSVSGFIRNNRQEMQTLGVAGLAMGAGVAAGFTASAKAAIDWESAFAGVIKTVDATEEELAGLERGLRDMALQIPATHEELAGIAEAAGQLGIETPNILGFTRVMADLGVSTNLTSEEAAVLFARFANISQLPQTEFSNLGSTIVELGNNLATTEREIGEMALRIAAAGSQIGLSHAEILGFAGALSSVGIEAQAGGTAISRVFIEVDKAVRSGGDTLEKFAETAGMSSEQFVDAYQRNAAGAMVTFIEGLRKISDEGGNVFGVLEELSLQDIRVRDALLRAAGAGDLFRESLGMANEAFEENNALSEEAARRYETVESQLTVMWNTVKEAAIAFGEVFLPVVVEVVGWIKTLAQWFADLPGPIKTVVAVGAALAGGLALVGGAALVLGPRIIMLVDAWKKLRAAMLAAKAAQFVPGIPGGVGTVGGAAARAVPVAAAGFAVGMAVKEGVKLANDIQSGQQDLARTLANLMQAAQQGDADAASRLNKFREQYVESQGFLTNIGDRLNFMGVRHQSQEIWKQAEALVEADKAAKGAVTSVHAFLEANDPQPIKTVTDATDNATVAVSRFLEANDVTADELRRSGEVAGGAAVEYMLLGQALYTVETAQRSLNNMYAESLNPVAAAVNAVDRLRQAEETLKEVQKDKKASDEDVARAQFDYAQALINTQVALDSLSYEDQRRAVDLFQAALGLTKDEAAELLERLGVMDGTRIAMYIDMYEQVKRDTGRSRVGGPSFIPELRAEGGPVSPGSLYKVGEGDRPELFMVPGDRGHMFSNTDTKALIAAFSGGGERNVTYDVRLEGTGIPEVDSQLIGATVSVLRRAEERVA